MRWTITGLIAGVALAMLVIMSVEAIGNQVAPPPAGLDLNAGSAESLPVTNLLFPVLGWFLGALLGAYAAVRLSGHGWAGWAIAAVVLAATILNFVLITHPVWVMALGVAAVLAGGWIGRLLAERRRGEEPVSA
jgi:hypothetical protein